MEGNRIQTIFVPRTNKNGGMYVDLRDARLIFPVVSVGNVGQLCVDLLIETPEMGFKSIGYLDEEYVLPVVGNMLGEKEASKGSCRLAVPLEVFYSKDMHLVAVQQRAPIIKGFERDVAEHVCNWVQQCGIEQVLLLSSIQAHRRSDAQLSADPNPCYIASRNANKLGSIANELGWSPMCHSDINHMMGQLSIQPGDERLDSRRTSDFLGNESAKQIYAQFEQSSVSVLIAVLYSTEGENAPDGLRMAGHVADFLNALNTLSVGMKGGSPMAPQWKVPEAWRFVYGTVQNAENIYT